MLHLTETGYYAGRRLCAARDYKDGDRNVHAAYAPLHLESFRADCCPHCLRIWAFEAYDEDDDMPDYIRAIRDGA